MKYPRDHDTSMRLFISPAPNMQEQYLQAFEYGLLLHIAYRMLHRLAVSFQSSVRVNYTAVIGCRPSPSLLLAGCTRFSLVP